MEKPSKIVRKRRSTLTKHTKSYWRELHLQIGRNLSSTWIVKKFLQLSTSHKFEIFIHTHPFSDAFPWSTKLSQWMSHSFRVSEEVWISQSASASAHRFWFSKKVEVRVIVSKSAALHVIHIEKFPNNNSRIINEEKISKNQMDGESLSCFCQDYLKWIMKANV